MHRAPKASGSYVPVSAMAQSVWVQCISSTADRRKAPAAWMASPVTCSARAKPWSRGASWVLDHAGVLRGDAQDVRTEGLHVDRRMRSPAHRGADAPDQGRDVIEQPRVATLSTPAWTGHDAAGVLAREARSHQDRALVFRGRRNLIQAIVTTLDKVAQLHRLQRVARSSRQCIGLDLGRDDDKVRLARFSPAPCGQRDNANAVTRVTRARRRRLDGLLPWQRRLDFTIAATLASRTSLVALGLGGAALPLERASA